MPNEIKIESPTQAGRLTLLNTWNWDMLDQVSLTAEE
jgi:hypothetical protein